MIVKVIFIIIFTRKRIRLFQRIKIIFRLFSWLARPFNLRGQLTLAERRIHAKSAIGSVLGLTTHRYWSWKRSTVVIGTLGTCWLILCNLKRALKFRKQFGMNFTVCFFRLVFVGSFILAIAQFLGSLLFNLKGSFFHFKASFWKINRLKKVRT